MTDQLDRPLLHCTAAHDRITPAVTAPRGEIVEIQSGHVGMIVGAARRQLYAGLAAFFDPSCRSSASTAKRSRHAPVAQLDRALPSEGRGHRFESCRVRHFFKR